MNSTGTTVREAPSIFSSGAQLREDMFRGRGTEKYESVLHRVQQAGTGWGTGGNDLGGEALRSRILEYITDHGITCSITDSPMELTSHLYHDMAEYSFITREGLFQREGFEELDINRWDDVDIILFGRREKTPYRFLSPQHAIDIHRRMLQKTGVTLDDATPTAVTDLGDSIRITVLKAPVVDPEAGIASSIRKVSGATITRERLEGSSLTPDMLDLLDLCLRYGASACFSGDTGSGKTTLAGYLLREAARDLRVYTIEEGSREWDFLHYGEDGRVRNSVVHMKTRSSEDPRLAITQNKGLQLALRFNPVIIGVGEMRSDEAYAATEASLTGHTVVTTVHANSAIEAPKRIVGLCKKAYDFSDSTLMDMVADAWPIQVFHELMPDRVRRVTQIAEILGYREGLLEYRMLYEFHTEDNIRHPDGRVEVVGGFRKVGGISERLYRRMLRRGATRQELDRFRREEAEA